jgi:hypothetical protein
MLRASTKRIVDTKTLICTSFKSVRLRRHRRFPSPESTAVDMTIVAPTPHSEAATSVISLDRGICRRRDDRHLLMIRIAVHSA